MFVAVDAQPRRLLAVPNPIQAHDGRGDPAKLHDEGLRSSCYGRQPHDRAAVARTLGIDDVVADVPADQKVDAVKRLQAEGRFRRPLAGDGINDAPALRAEHRSGIAMGDRH